MENQKSLQWFYREIIPTATWSGLIHSWVNASRCSSEWVARFQCNMYHVLLVRSLLLLRCCFVSDFHSTHGLTFLAAVLSSFFQFQRSQNLLLFPVPLLHGREDIILAVVDNNTTIRFQTRFEDGRWWWVSCLIKHH